MIKPSCHKQKALFAALLLIANVLCTVSVCTFDIETTTLKIIGSFAAVIIVCAVAWLFPLCVYCPALIFVFFAASLGSCVNLYWHVRHYDRFVHYLSGILLAYAGYVVCEYLFKKRDINGDSLIKNLFAFLLSSSCAAFWEIYEFTADNIIKANMQGSNNNTMGDIVSGVLGAATFFAVSMLISKSKHGKNRQ